MLLKTLLFLKFIALTFNMFNLLCKSFNLFIT